MKSPFALQLVLAGALLSFSVMPIFAQDSPTPIGAPDPSTLPEVPTPAKNWPEPIKDNRFLSYVTFDELESRTNGPNTSFRWDGEGWVGTDFNKVWIKSEGTVTNGSTSDGDQEFLYDRPIPHMRYFDWQAGTRVDLDSGPTRAWLALGVEGLSRYFFNFAPTFYIRDGGRVAGRIEGYYDLYLTQRLILQPQAELNFYSQADHARGIGTGLSDIDGGVRLGFQFSRKFAPYIGYVYSGTFGQTAMISRQSGQPSGLHQFVFGIWLWH
jgi:copper resistance protein B